MRMLSTKRRCRILTNLETLIPVILPFAWLFFRRLKPFITKMKRSSERGQPCRRPLPLWKKEEGSPFTKTTKVALVTQLIIQFKVVWLNLVWIKISLRKSQSMQSKDFLRYSLRMRAQEFLWLMMCKHSCAMPIASRICRPFKKPSCSPDSERERMGLILLAMIF